MWGLVRAEGERDTHTAWLLLRAGRLGRAGVLTRTSFAPLSPGFSPHFPGPIPGKQTRTKILSALSPAPGAEVSRGLGLPSPLGSKAPRPRPLPIPLSRLPFWVSFSRNYPTPPIAGWLSPNHPAGLDAPNQFPTPRRGPRRGRVVSGCAFFSRLLWTKARRSFLLLPPLGEGPAGGNWRRPPSPRPRAARRLLPAVQAPQPGARRVRGVCLVAFLGLRPWSGNPSPG